MSSIVMKRPVGRSRDRFVAAILALAVPSIALADGGVTCPPGTGSIEFWAQVSGPDPIIVDMPPGLGPVEGVTLPGAPDTAGTAVIDGNALVISTVSPPGTPGLSSGSMIAVTIAAPDPAAPPAPDPSGSPCNPDLVVSVATDIGKSARPLLAATEAIFPAQQLSSAVLGAPTSGTFFPLALQNPEPADSTVSVDLLDAAGSVVASASLALPPRTKVSREFSELFPGVIPSAGSVFVLTATVSVQMLGLSGDEN